MQKFYSSIRDLLICKCPKRTAKKILPKFYFIELIDNRNIKLINFLHTDKKLIVKKILKY